ncbi:MAG: hypothetical protein QOI85_1652 [Chloroflexota bacterium]|jgi:hypothetical protein|nr:hypothetical protein [Gaiellales bacterium]MEA2651931.1 hypothetical protein [Chloroflexota bacterium]
MLIGPSVSFGRAVGVDPARRNEDVELGTGSALLVMGLLLAALVAVMWLLAATRRSPD